MAKGKIKSAAAKATAKATRAHTPQRPPCDDIPKPKNYGNKKIYTSFVGEHKPVAWVEINPHKSSESEGEGEEDCFAVDRMPKINLPPAHLDVSKLRSCGILVHDSKVYFIGGLFFHRLYPYSFSGGVFTYHLVSHEWEELPCKLNIPRASPIVSIVANVIYVMGGMVSEDNRHINHPEHWIECFNIDETSTKTSFDFLPAPSAPPNILFQRVPAYWFAYEPGNEIVFVMSEQEGAYSFNCVSKTWAPFRDANLSKHVSFRRPGERAVVVDHLVFFLNEEIIMHAYDLMKNRLVLSQHLSLLYEKESHNGFYHEYEPDLVVLERVGNDTLLLIVLNYGAGTDKPLRLYKMRIENLASDDEEELHLRLIGSGHFVSPGSYITNAVSF